MITFAGDSNSDAEVMKKAQEIADKSAGKICSLGILVKSSNNQNEINHTANLVLDGVNEYAQFLNLLTKVL